MVVARGYLPTACGCHELATTRSLHEFVRCNTLEHKDGSYSAPLLRDIIYLIFIDMFKVG